MALMSGKVYSNTGAPNNADGVNGDIYMQLDGFKTTYRKEGGSWVAVGSTLGAIPEFVSGVGVPSNSLGTDGQYYRNTANQDIYYKQGATWNIIGNLDNSSISAKLSQAGIGKYLGTAPNVVTTGSMNDLVIAGEYYVTGSVTDMPPNVGAGYAKVWGLNSGNVAQIMQRTLGSSVFEIHFRQSSSGTFGAWRSLADSEGSSSQVFKVANAVADQDATAKLQVETMITDALGTTASPQAYGRFKNVAPSPDIQYFNNTLLTYMVARNSLGWEVTFFPNLTSADYVVVGSVTGGGGYGGRSFEPYDQTVSGFKIKSQWGGDNTAGPSTQDGAEVNFVVF